MENLERNADKEASRAELRSLAEEFIDRYMAILDSDPEKAKAARKELEELLDGLKKDE